MIKSITKICIGLLCLSFSFNIQAQLFETKDQVSISGQVFNAADTTALAQTHVVIPSLKAGTVTDYTGLFNITVKRGEIVILTTLGFKADTIKTDNLAKLNHLVFFLEQQTVELPDVVIFPFPHEYAMFKNHFLGMEIDAPSYDIDLDLPSTTRGTSKISAPPTGFGVAFASPLSWLYNKFSKQAKSKREFLRLTREDAYRAELAVKYNSQMVAQLTGLTKPETIEAFMEFCDLPDPFVEDSDIYEILEAVQTCWAEFKTIKAE